MNEKEQEIIEDPGLQIQRNFISDALDLDQKQKNLDKAEQMKDFMDFVASLPREQRRKFIKEKFSDRIKKSFRNKSINEREGNE